MNEWTLCKRHRQDVNSLSLSFEIAASAAPSWCGCRQVEDQHVDCDLQFLLCSYIQETTVASQPSSLQLQRLHHIVQPISTDRTLSTARGEPINTMTRASFLSGHCGSDTERMSILRLFVVQLVLLLDYLPRSLKWMNSCELGSRHRHPTSGKLQQVPNH